MDVSHSQVAESFSLARGGLVARLQARFGRVGPQRERVIHRAVLAALLTWLPLLILSLAEGLAYGTAVTVPFLRISP
jgi:hypothetical protein